MFDPLLRPLKDRILRPVARRALWLHPGWITLAGVIAGLSAAWAGFRGAFLAGALLWFLSRILDGLDGLVARERGTASELGGLLDLVADYLVYAGIPVALALRPGAPEGLLPAALILLAVFYVNSAAWMIPSALLERRGPTAGPTTVTIPEGLISGGETVVFYLLFFLVPGEQVVLFWTMAALTGVTVIQRMIWATRTFSSDPEPSRAPDAPPATPDRDQIPDQGRPEEEGFASESTPGRSRTSHRAVRFNSSPAR